MVLFYFIYIYKIDKCKCIDQGLVGKIPDVTDLSAKPESMIVYTIKYLVHFPSTKHEHSYKSAHAKGLGYVSVLNAYN